MHYICIIKIIKKKMATISQTLSRLILIKGTGAKLVEVLRGYLDGTIDDSKMETRGDLEELNKMLDEYDPESLETDLEMANGVLGMAMASYGVIGYQEFLEIPSIKEFNNKYPKLTETFQVVAWS